MRERARESKRARDESNSITRGSRLRRMSDVSDFLKRDFERIRPLEPPKLDATYSKRKARLIPSIYRAELLYYRRIRLSKEIIRGAGKSRKIKPSRLS